MKFVKNDFRGDYEVIDDRQKLRGFVWKYEGAWVVRIDDRQAQNRNTFNQAKALAEDLCA